MSGAAYAYTVEEEFDLFEDAPAPDFLNSSPVRLLGIQGKGDMSQAMPLLPLYSYGPAPAPQYPQYRAPAARYEIPASSLEGAPLYEPEPYYAYPDNMVVEEAPVKRITAHLGRLLVVGLLGVAAVSMLAIVAPALAHSGQDGLRLSGYRDVAVGAVAGAKTVEGAPVIDVTSDRPAPDQPQPPLSVAPPSINVAPATSAYALEGPPTLSVRQIEAVLTQYGSPAAGSGQKLYDLGVKYGINPAFALAFFVHESGCGTKGVARFTKSVGNIRWTAGFDNYEGYRSYPTWEAGMEDWYNLIKNLYIQGWGLRTVDAIIPTYAPSGDSNDPPTYIASVKRLVDSWRGK